MNEIDKKFKKIKINKDKKLSEETSEFLNNFKEKFNQNTLNNAINEIKDQAYKEIENSLRKNLKMILDCLLDKASQKLDDLYNKYKYSNKSVCKKNNIKNDINIKDLGKIIVKTSLDYLSKILIDRLLEWIKDRINELIEMLLSQFNELFEEIGEKIIIIQESVGNIIDKIIEKVDSVINLVGDIKRIIKNILDVIQSKGDIEVVIKNLINISDFMLKNGIKNLTQPITDCVNEIKTGIKTTVNNEYNKIKNKGIKYYEKEKTKINNEYTKIKNKVVNLPDNLAKKIDEKKWNLKNNIRKNKKQIIKKTDINLKNIIDTRKIEKSFYDIIYKVQSNIDTETNKIKKEIKNNINNSNEFILDLYNDIIYFIYECMKYDIGKYVDNKFDAFEESVIFILDIISEKYEIENLDESILRRLLISHFKEKILLCEFLIGNNLFQTIIKRKNILKENYIQFIPIMI